MTPLTQTEIRNRECSKKADTYKKQLKLNRTKAEDHVYKLLLNFKKKNKVKFEYNPKFKFQKAFYKGNAFCIVDFFFPTTNSCLEIDGGYHYTEAGIAKDKWRDNYLKSRSVKVYHVTNEIALSWDIDSITAFLHENQIFGKGFKKTDTDVIKYFK